MAYKQGAYGTVAELATKAPVTSATAPVYIGTAPIHNVANGKVNVPVLVSTFKEAVNAFGYSDDWAAFTLCEAMYAHFKLGGVGPIVLINVWNPADETQTEATKTLTPVNGRAVIDAAQSIVLDSLEIEGKTYGTDFTASFDYATKKLLLTEVTSGTLGTGTTSLAYKTVEAPEVEAETVIGETDGNGVNSGLYAVYDVYQLCGVIPRYILAPGYSEQKPVHDAMETVSTQINGHWDAFIFTDLPLASSGTALTLSTAESWKTTNGYTCDNEKVHFPRYQGLDGNIYHLSVLEAVVKQAIDIDNDGIPYQTASNKALPVSGKLYFGEDGTALPDVETLNQKLCANGITTAAFVSGRWAVWGAHTASYTEGGATNVNVADVSLMMLYYVSNNFQLRRGADVGKVVTKNTLSQIVSEEVARLDALKAVGAIIYGDVYLDESGEDGAVCDYVNGDFTLRFEVTTTPLCKSLTAIVSYTAQGIATYYTEE